MPRGRRPNVFLDDRPLKSRRFAADNSGMTTNAVLDDVVMTRRLLAADESIPHGWTLVHSGDGYQVLERPERRAVARDESPSRVGLAAKWGA